MLYARMVRPPSRGATLTEVETTSLTAMGAVVTIVRDGNVLGVIAEREEVAVHAAERLRAHSTWDEQPTLPDEDDLPGFLTSAPSDTTVLAEVETAAQRRPVTTVAASREALFHRPFLAHAAMGPSCAVARVEAGQHPQLEVWSHSQGVYVLRRELARAFGIGIDGITVHHVKGPGVTATTVPTTRPWTR